jgi:dihydroflavonol-4-reductase
LPDWLVRTVALFNPVLRQVTGELGNVRAASSEHAMQRLGWQMRPVEQTILACARSLIETGVVKV